MIGWLDLAMEHHEAVVKLLAERLYGSAFSLVRGIFELMYKAYWVAFCAADQQVQKIAAKDNFDFPGTETMTQEVDKACGMGTYFADLKKQSWKAMNSYTHGGMLQLTRRFSGQRVEPNYSDGDIEEVVNATTAAILVFGQVLAATPDRAPQTKQLEDLAVAFAGRL